MKAAKKALSKLNGPQVLKLLEEHVTPTKKAYLKSTSAYLSPDSRKKMKAMKSLTSDLGEHLQNHAMNDYKSIQKRMAVCQYLAKRRKQAYIERCWA